MAPIQRRNTNLSLQGTVAVIILVIMFVTGIFCTVVFMKICSKQRRRERAMRRMQEQNAPYVGVQYTAPPGAPSNGSMLPPYAGQAHVPTELHGDQHKHNGPQELQGEGRPEFAQPQQIDGYMAAPTVDNSDPIELPANAIVNNHGNNGAGGFAMEEPQQEKKTAFARMQALFK